METKKAQYPTHEQMKEIWDAWKERGAEGIREILEKRLRRSAEQKSTPPPASADDQ
jgi:hypothetical protein